ncbi:unnamed protein product [Lampetra fluviatilis]
MGCRTLTVFISGLLVLAASSASTPNIPPGYYDDETSKACVVAKTYGSSLHISTPFSDKMEDPTSEEFRGISIPILKMLSSIFGGLPDYKGSAVIKLRSGSVFAEVVNMFDTESNVTEEFVSSEVNETITLCTGQDSSTVCGNLPILSASAMPTCALGACDSNTSKCVEKDGFMKCNCLPGFIQQEGYERLCSVCPIDFKEEKGKCVECPSPASGYNCMICPDGYKNENGTCRTCSFGYNGKNCQDGSLLALVIVAVCCGVLILALGITLIVTYIRKRKGKGYSDDGNDVTPTLGYSHMKKKEKVADMDGNPPSALYDFYTAIPRVSAKVASESFNHAQNSSRNATEDDDSDNKRNFTGHTNVAAKNDHDTYY